MRNDASLFDVPYAIPSSRLTSTSAAYIISTTAADYVGLAIHVVSAPVTVLLFNSISAATGGLLDAITVSASTRIIAPIMVRAKIGLVASVTGTTGAATVFYAPKG